MFRRANRVAPRHARAGRSSQPQVGDEVAGVAARPTDPAPLPAGPYDLAEAPPGVDRRDLGSLRIPLVPGVSTRLQPGPEEGTITQFFLVDGESMLQLRAFAAPRTESIWDEVREEIRASIVDQGGAAAEVAGPYGVELQARITTPQGPRDLRFVGVSGPRWLLRAVYYGPAALDPARAERLAECLRGVVVDRGHEARPSKEPLPLRQAPPAEPAPQPGSEAEPARR